MHSICLKNPIVDTDKSLCTTIVNFYWKFFTIKISHPYKTLSRFSHLQSACWNLNWKPMTDTNKIVIMYHYCLKHKTQKLRCRADDLVLLQNYFSLRGSLFILSTHKVCLQTQLHLILEIKSFYNLLSKFPTFKCQRKTFPLQNRHLINIFQKKKRTKNRKKLSCTPYRDFFHDYEDYLWFIFQYLPKLSSWKELKALSKSSQGKGCWNDTRIRIVR